MADIKRTDSIIEFTGGSYTDAPLGERPVEDLENLLPPIGGGKGLRPRSGIEPVVAVHPADREEGCCVFLVTLDESARTQAVVCYNASTEQIINVFQFTEQEGRRATPPYSGGTDPDDPNSEPELPETPEPVVEYANAIRFTQSSVSVEPGETKTLYVQGVNAGGTAIVFTADGTAKAGEDYTAVSGTVTASGAQQDEVTVVVSEDATAGSQFNVVLANPTPTKSYLGNPSKCLVTVGGSVTLVPFSYSERQGSSPGPYTSIIYMYDTTAEDFVAEPIEVSCPEILGQDDICRTESYLFMDGTNEYYVYSLADLAENGSEATPTIIEDPYYTGGSNAFFSYPGDIVFVARNRSLYQINCEAGTITEVAAAMGGLPESYSVWYQPGGVDSEGRLLCKATYDGTHRFLSIDPSDGSGTDLTHGGNTFGGSIFSCSPTSDGGWIMMRSSTTDIRVTTLDSSLNFVDEAATIEDADWVGAPTYAGCYLNGNVVVTQHDLSEVLPYAILTVNASTGETVASIVGPLFGEYEVIRDENTFGVVVRSSDDLNWEWRRINASTGAQVGDTVVLTSVPIEGAYFPIPDAFGYLVKNVAGSAL